MLDKKILFFLILVFPIYLIAATESNFTIARIKYDGGGDWYNDPNILSNLLEKFEKRTKIPVNKDNVVVSIKDDDFFNYPVAFLTGHGNIRFSDIEIDRLRTYLNGGGFLYIDDDYGLDKNIKRELKKLYPEKELILLPDSHPIYNCYYKLDKLPKIHEHDNKQPKGYGVFHNGKMIIYYTYESNISDGWTEVHKNPKETRELAFKMGINILFYSLIN